MYDIEEDVRKRELAVKEMNEAIEVAKQAILVFFERPTYFIARILRKIC